MQQPADVATQELVARAGELLGCRPGVPAREVRAAYRALLHVGRPDTGRADGAWLARVQAARDLLLSCAGPERRRRDRGPAGLPATYLPLRRATWQADALPERSLDLSL